MFEVRESGKPDPCEEKSTTTEIQDKICSRHVHWKNPTHIKKNLSRQRHKVKCA